MEKFANSHAYALASRPQHLTMLLAGAGACVMTLVGVAGIQGWIVTSPAPQIFGASYTAWGARFLLGLALLSLLMGGNLWRFFRVTAAWLILLASTSSLWRPDALGASFSISRLSSLTLILFSIALLCLGGRRKLTGALVPWLALGGMAVNTVTLLGYLYNATRLYGGAGGTIGVCSAVASLCIGVGLLAAAGPERLPLRLLAGESITAQLLRGVLPVTCGAMLLGEIVLDSVRGEQGDRALQDALQTFFAATLITGVVLVLARRVGKRLEAIESQRDLAEAALSSLNRSLAKAVADRTRELESLNVDLRTEIATRREIERALRESQNKNEALLSALPDWIFRLGPDGSILDMRSPRERPSGNGHGPGLAANVIDWVRSNPNIRGAEMIDFLSPARGETFEGRFVRASNGEVLAVVRDVSELARLEKEVLEATAAEQRRIGEELHDGLGQQLTATAFRAKILEMSLREKELPDAEEAAEIGKQVSIGIGSIRTLARGLFRYEISTECFVTALHELASIADKSFRVECTVDADDSITMPDRATSLHLYRICQEAINNAVKHGKAKKIRLQLRRASQKIVFTIQDDGIGVTFRDHNEAGIGLRTMAFRTRRLGGWLGIESHPGKGTLITCTLPDHGPSIIEPCPTENQPLLL